MEAVNKQKNMNGKAEGMVQQSKSTDKIQAMNKDASMNEEMGQESLFKKWWFWVAVAAGILIIIFAVWFFLF